jgi:short-subunit dehydrogenase
MTDILITGASDGIGLATARLLANDGARVTLLARNEQKLQEAVKSLPGAGHEFIVADLSQRGDAEQTASRLASRHYDVLINNAGIGLYGRLTDLPLLDQQRMMALNMESVVVLACEFLRHARAGDALVNTASMLAYAPLPGAAVYSATKAFVAVFSETLWWEYRKRGVYVLGFCPGVIRTGFHSAAGGSVGRFPRLLVQSPDAAARELVGALRRRRGPRAVSGLGTRLFLLLQQLLSRKTAIKMMGTVSPIREIS